MAPRTAAVLSLMQMGVADLALIAAAVGLTREEVERIDAAEDPLVRRLAVQGVPEEFVFRLRREVTCPNCGSRIFLVPCMSCKIVGLRAGDRRGRDATQARAAAHTA